MGKVSGKLAHLIAQAPRFCLPLGSNVDEVDLWHLHPGWEGGLPRCALELHLQTDLLASAHGVDKRGMLFEAAPVELAGLDFDLVPGYWEV